MITPGNDTLKSLRTLTVNGRTYQPRSRPVSATSAVCRSP